MKKTSVLLMSVVFFVMVGLGFLISTEYFFGETKVYGYEEFTIEVPETWTEKGPQNSYFHTNSLAEFHKRIRNLNYVTFSIQKLNEEDVISLERYSAQIKKSLENNISFRPSLEGKLTMTEEFYEHASTGSPTYRYIERCKGTTDCSFPSDRFWLENYILDASEGFYVLSFYVVDVYPSLTLRREFDFIAESFQL